MLHRRIFVSYYAEQYVIWIVNIMPKLLLIDQLVESVILAGT